MGYEYNVRIEKGPFGFLMVSIRSMLVVMGVSSRRWLMAMAMVVSPLMATSVGELVVVGVAVIVIAPAF